MGAVRPHPFKPMSKRKNQTRLKFLAVIFTCAALSYVFATPATQADGGKTAGHEWPAHGGNPEHTQSSPLAQINTTNVQRLKVAWTYNTGDKRDDNRSQIQCNPIVIDGILYGTSPQIKVFALIQTERQELRIGIQTPEMLDDLRRATAQNGVVAQGMLAHPFGTTGAEGEKGFAHRAIDFRVVIRQQADESLPLLILQFSRRLCLRKTHRTSALYR